MVDVPASRFLRPARKNGALERLRLWRITSAMETAARHRKLFHLWWHPHNFGVDLQKNLTFLRNILDCFAALPLLERAARDAAAGTLRPEKVDCPPICGRIRRCGAISKRGGARGYGKSYKAIPG
jgi:hypothetical protein